MYIRHISNGNIYRVADNKSDALLGEVVLDEGYYIPKILIPEDISNSYGFIIDETGEYCEIGNLDLKENFHISNFQDIDTSIDGIILANKYNEINTNIVYSEEEIFAPDISNHDNFLCKAIKTVFKKKNIPLKLYDEQFGKEHNKNNTIKAIRTGKITDKKFIQLCDMLGVEYALVMVDKEGVSHPMGEPVMVSTENFNDDSLLEMIESFKK